MVVQSISADSWNAWARRTWEWLDRRSRDVESVEPAERAHRIVSQRVWHASFLESRDDDLIGDLPQNPDIESVLWYTESEEELEELAVLVATWPIPETLQPSMSFQFASPAYPRSPRTICICPGGNLWRRRRLYEILWELPRLRQVGLVIQTPMYATPSMGALLGLALRRSRAFASITMNHPSVCLMPFVDIAQHLSLKPQHHYSEIHDDSHIPTHVRLISGTYSGTGLHLRGVSNPHVQFVRLAPPCLPWTRASFRTMLPRARFQPPQSDLWRRQLLRALTL